MLCNSAVEENSLTWTSSDNHATFVPANRSVQESMGRVAPTAVMDYLGLSSHSELSTSELYNVEIESRGDRGEK